MKECAMYVTESAELLRVKRRKRREYKELCVCLQIPQLMRSQNAARPLKITTQEGGSGNVI